MTARGTTPEERAHQRVKDFTGVMWHLLVFVLLNGGLWWLDIAKGDGLNWAYWLTIFWGIGLIFHIGWYLLSERGAQARRYQRILAEEKSTDHD